MSIEPHTIRINELLLAREAQFVRVYDLETQINTLLGGDPYPFTRPLLPSDQRRKPGKKSPLRVHPDALPSVRQLDPGAGETAYRVTYTQHGKTVTEDHDLPDALRTLLASQGAQLRILRIETLDATGATREVIFEQRT
ncbi:hypothetical protein Ga0100231_000410 [Opitutaceae bacterium TAV4]|uniref:hypothetical protein n=1 Tax=Geminisphaera colitermitum TaxID=1148786 RepID=UPI0001965593|nr:hypothetical protein [Geminisphaera colitermitum]RRK01321.1 hypothetical protein Ga0100231_000410 [Opitutaceae bacterium TAV4]RRK01592.1 hypothetical protein Ga0100230_007025 [Opitutaceae bacterium TAV3]RRK01645.1 hypothetical protein Ga0100230_007355 [Opitutaceae bacterium TAV3]